jgi:hypothetical protein
VKVPLPLHYQSFQEIRLKPLFNPLNSCLSKKQNNSRNLILLAIMKAYELVKERKEKLGANDSLKKEKKTKSTKKGKAHQKKQHPEPSCSEEEFKQLVYQELLLLGINVLEQPFKAGGMVDKRLLDQFIHQFHSSSLVPSSVSSDVFCSATVSVIGSILSQEVIKVLTSMYLPIQQLLMFEAFSSLSLLSEVNNKLDSSSSTSSLISYPYNKRMKQEMKKLKVFVVGSGAIGCELLKNFALLGIGCSKQPSSASLNKDNDSPEVSTPSGSSLWKKYGLEEGGIIITDMDLIEKSNLNRQLLFRSHHIGQSKAMIAAEEIIKINPFMNILPLSYKVDENTEKEIFNEDFWKEADIIITALV